MQYEVIREGETLDEIVYYYYGSVFGYIEKVLDANPLLYKQDTILEVGLIIELPDITINQVNSRTKLWS